MTKRQGCHRQTRDNLVAHTEEQSTIKHVMGQPHRRRHRYHFAA
ncbi:Uncharacterised protein [Shigella sonnei]|nr:Uncharacterised protein [Shigella sonnei]